jgi:outer membrane lipoprotein-sorting protein
MKKKTTITLMVLVLGAFAAVALYAEPTGAEIMQAVYDRPQGRDTSGTLTMTLADSRGRERVRVLKQILGRYGDIDKKLMVFQSPADVRGTSFMNWSYKAEGKDDDQWIYLPALKRVRRISSEGKGDYFMGSDFTYDDLGDRHPSEDTHKLTGTETVDGEECWVVESVPKDPGYMYSRTVTRVSKEKNVGVKRDFYDRRGSHLKTLTVHRVEKISGAWVLLKVEMRNVRNNTHTIMEFTDVAVDTGIPENSFSERTMTRGL